VFLIKRVICVWSIACGRVSHDDCIPQRIKEVVSERQDGIKAVKYDRIVTLLIEAIKELSEKVDNLQK
jgi:hypothetical protein